MLDSGKLIANRDTLSDVGIAIKVEGQLVRGNLKDCSTAAAKRLTEALRTIAEAAQTINKPVAAAIESLRYTAYTLEKDIFLAGDVRGRFESVRLYAILTADHPADIIRLAQACCEGGADCIQLRAKNMPDDELYACAIELSEICRNANVISIINDRIDIAVAAGADGVHLGINDIPIDAARKVAASPMIFGLTTHNLDELRAAIDSGADYIGVGPAFTTATKPNLKPAGLEYIKAASQIAQEAGISHVAIGGITLDNIDKVLAAGAKAVAVSSALVNTANPVAMCMELKRKITSA